MMLSIWTDGSCLGNPGPGGWAVYVPHTHYIEVGGENETTNNRMEATAILKAIEYVEKLPPQHVTIVSDSQWAISCSTKQWKAKANLDILRLIWSLLDELSARQQIRFEWVRGHSMSPENNFTDMLAIQEARKHGP